METTPTSAVLGHRVGGVSRAVDDALIRAVVDDFYDVVRQDSLLGPVFEARVADWPPHLEKMYGFWATALRGERRYEGNPLEKHQSVTELTGDHFARWLELFAETVRRHCSPADSEAWEASARRMGFAMSYRLGFGERSDLLP